MLFGEGVEKCTRSACALNLKIERQLLWILDALLYFYEKCDRFFSIDRTVIVTQGEVHHRANFDFPIHGDWSRHDFVHPENAALRRIENRRAQQRAVNAAV